MQSSLSMSEVPNNTEHISKKQQKLIEQCKQNDRRAQIKLYEQYAKAMYAISLNIIKDQYAAEDAMQEAFIAAFEKINTYKGEVRFGAWLKRIVINKCLDYLKKRKVQFDSIENHADFVESEEINDTTKSIFEVEKIKNEILNLPDGYRTILTLYLLEGYDHEEIAEILEISASTSRSQYTRAKALLLKRLKE